MYVCTATVQAGDVQRGFGQRVGRQRRRRLRRASPHATSGTRMTTTFPAPVFDHLLRLTDRRGTFGHARLAEPLPEHGYCTDDVARVLVVATRDHGPDRTLNGLAGVALRFLNDAQALTGACRNEMDSMGSLGRRASPRGRLGAVHLGSGDRGRAQQCLLGPPVGHHAVRACRPGAVGMATGDGVRGARRCRTPRL